MGTPWTSFQKANKHFCSLVCRPWAATSETSRSTRRRRSPTSSAWWKARATWTRKATASANPWIRPPGGVTDQIRTVPTQETWTPRTVPDNLLRFSSAPLTPPHKQDSQQARTHGVGGVHFLLRPNNELAQLIVLHCISSSSSSSSAWDYQGAEAALRAGACTAGPTSSFCNFSCQYVQNNFVVKYNVLYFCLKSKNKTCFWFIVFLLLMGFRIYTEERPCQTGSALIVFCFVFFSWENVLKDGAERAALKLSRCVNAMEFTFSFFLIFRICNVILFSSALSREKVSTRLSVLHLLSLAP